MVAAGAQRRVERVLIIANLHKGRAGELAAEIQDELTRRGIQTVVFTFEGKPNSPPLDGYDLAFSLGGDGTVLFASRTLAGTGTPIIGVNLGDFGFLTEIGEQEWADALEEYINSRLPVAERIMQRVTVARGGGCIAEFVGLNDTVISAAGIAKIIRLSVWVGENLLGRYRADGIIIATPTGSTAHSAAAGGPILSPEMDAMIVNPICPFTLSHRPVVVPGGEQISIKVEEQQRSDVLLTVDGQLVQPLEAGDSICVTRSELCARIVRSRQRGFFEVLRSKLNWSAGPDPEDWSGATAPTAAAEG